MNSENFNFSGLVDAIRHAHASLLAQASQAVNISLTLRNWFIGHYISEYELKGSDRAKYGDRLLAELSSELRNEQISNTGKRQLYNYLGFYRSYPQIVRTVSAQSARLLSAESSALKMLTASAQSDDSASIDPELLLNRLSYSHFEQLVNIDVSIKRRFYEVETLRGCWSVRELRRQIASQYFERSSLSTDREVLARLTHQKAEIQNPQHIIRDPYIFEFIGLRPQEVMTERAMELALLDKLQAFLIELGHGFCFEASQKRIIIGGEHCFVDLVFYHRILKCHVLIELKNDSFRHEHLGQLNTYVSYYSDNEMTSGDQPPIGILLCTQKNHEMVRYALAGMNNNLFVSRYQLQLPKQGEMEAFLRKAMAELKIDGGRDGV